MRNNTVAEIKKILDFLRIPYLDEDLKDRLKRGFSTFKRLADSPGRHAVSSLRRCPCFRGSLYTSLCSWEGVQCPH